MPDGLTERREMGRPENRRRSPAAAGIAGSRRSSRDGGGARCLRLRERGRATRLSSICSGLNWAEVAGPRKKSEKAEESGTKRA